METSSSHIDRKDSTRQRLPPAVRTQQILNAALSVFSERGFAAARMDDIAQASGLSKGGLYAHFASKDEVFEALLSQLLAPPELEQPSHPLPLSAEQWVDWLLDEIYARVTAPELRAGLRLLVAEGGRVPELVARWHGQVMQPYVDALAALLAQGMPATADGLTPLLVREPWLALSPVVHGLIMQTVLPTGVAYSWARLRDGHRQMLLCLIRG